LLTDKKVDKRWVHKQNLLGGGYVSSDNSRPMCYTSDVSTNIRNIHHRPAMLWRFSWFWRRISKLPTYLLTYFLEVTVTKRRKTWTTHWVEQNDEYMHQKRNIPQSDAGKWREELA